MVKSSLNAIIISPAHQIYDYSPATLYSKALIMVNMSCAVMREWMDYVHKIT